MLSVRMHKCWGCWGWYQLSGSKGNLVSYLVIYCEYMGPSCEYTAWEVAAQLLVSVS
jgi:hypothetical protein